MTATTPNRAPSTPTLLRPSTLLLAAAIALEVVGVRALAPGNADADADASVASIDGTAVAVAGAPVRLHHAATVEVRIVAQADLPNR
jgi:hypothetical protein